MDNMILVHFQHAFLNADERKLRALLVNPDLRPQDVSETIIEYLSGAKARTLDRAPITTLYSLQDVGVMTPVAAAVKIKKIYDPDFIGPDSDYWWYQLDFSDLKNDLVVEGTNDFLTEIGPCLDPNRTKRRAAGRRPW